MSIVHQTSADDRPMYSPPYVAFCPMAELAFTVAEWRPHIHRKRYVLVVCPFCSDVSIGQLDEHAVELLEVRQ